MVQIAHATHYTTYRPRNGSRPCTVHRFSPFCSFHSFLIVRLLRACLRVHLQGPVPHRLYPRTFQTLIFFYHPKVACPYSCPYDSGKLSTHSIIYLMNALPSCNIRTSRRRNR